MGSEDEGDRQFGVSRKIMFTAVGSLLGVVTIIILLHLYARYLLRRQERRRRTIGMVHSLRAQIAPIDISSTNDPPKLPGLDPSVIASLPKFTYKLSTDSNPQEEEEDNDERDECSVCLGTIMEECVVRVLPNCKHMFHVECIDTWLGSNTTCPICRTTVEPLVEPENEEGGARVQPTAPPADENTSHGAGQVEKEGGPSSSSLASGSGSRFGSFRRMLGRERSARRSQSCGNEIMGVQDLERQ